MSQILRLEVPDPLYKAIEGQAAAQGSDPAAVAVSALEQLFQRTAMPNRDTSDSESFEALFGAVDLGYPTGLDNEAIDADLAKEYARGMPN